MSIRVVSDKMLLENVQASEDNMQGGIYIPDAAQKRTETYVVAGIGTGGKDGKGDDIVFPAKVGDQVLIAEYGGTAVKHGGKVYKIVSYLDILAVIEEDKKD